MNVAYDVSAALTIFVAWYGEHIRGDEKSEAQLFLDHLLRAFGHAGQEPAARRRCRTRQSSLSALLRLTASAR